MNPVTIKPEIKKDEKVDFVKKLKEGAQKIKSANPPLPVDAPKPPSHEEINNFVNYEE